MRRVHKEHRIREEVSRARADRDFYLSRVDQAKAIEAMECPFVANLVDAKQSLVPRPRDNLRKHPVTPEQELLGLGKSPLYLRWILALLSFWFYSAPKWLRVISPKLIRSEWFRVVSAKLTRSEQFLCSEATQLRKSGLPNRMYDMYMAASILYPASRFSCG